MSDTSFEVEKVNWLDYYEFEIYEPPVNWNAVAGLYIFAGPNSTQTAWIAFYIGHTESLAARLPTHEYWSVAWELGATHIHVRVEPQEETRQTIEEELIRHYQPRLNDLHR